MLAAGHSLRGWVACGGLAPTITSPLPAVSSGNRSQHSGLLLPAARGDGPSGGGPRALARLTAL